MVSGMNEVMYGEDRKTRAYWDGSSRGSACIASDCMILHSYCYQPWRSCDVEQVYTHDSWVPFCGSVAD